jgi:hypothetical protein
VHRLHEPGDFGKVQILDHGRGGSDAHVRILRGSNRTSRTGPGTGFWDRVTAAVNPAQLNVGAGTKLAGPKSTVRMDSVTVGDVHAPAV